MIHAVRSLGETSEEVPSFFFFRLAWLLSFRRFRSFHLCVMDLRGINVYILRRVVDPSITLYIAKKIDRKKSIVVSFDVVTTIIEINES